MSMWDDEVGYDRDDPKHPDYARVRIDAADDQRKRDRENGILNPLVEEWKDQMRAKALLLGPCPKPGCIDYLNHPGGHYIVARRVDRW